MSLSVTPVLGHTLRGYVYYPIAVHSTVPLWLLIFGIIYNLYHEFNQNLHLNCEYNSYCMTHHWLAWRTMYTVYLFITQDHTYTIPTVNDGVALWLTPLWLKINTSEWSDHIRPIDTIGPATSNTRNPVWLQGGPKNGTIFWYAITLPNINRFSKLFHCQESGENL